MTQDVIVAVPSKRLYRQRAHCNPWSDHGLDPPICPSDVNWEEIYDVAGSKQPTCLDIGCGYGGLLMKLAEVFPEINSLGVEIRLKVSDYVQERIKASRINKKGSFLNVACIRANAMKNLINYFSKGSLDKMFFLYPDPHFKRLKIKWRIISPVLLSHYAFLLKKGGLLHAGTDVEELSEWMFTCLSKHPSFKIKLFVRLRIAFVERSKNKINNEAFNSPQDEEMNDDLLEVIPTSMSTINSREELISAFQQHKILRYLCHGCTEEAQKAAREKRGTSMMIFERI